MIKFTLKCDQDHQFDSWFQSAEAYEKLSHANMVTCAVCGSTKVTKAIMAPRVQASRTKTALTSPKNMRTTPSPLPEHALAALKKKVEETSEYVGTNFATEARDMHDGLAPERPIHGEAKLEDAKKLIDDGVPVLPLPFTPKRNVN